MPQQRAASACGTLAVQRSSTQHARARSHGHLPAPSNTVSLQRSRFQTLPAAARRREPRRGGRPPPAPAAPPPSPAPCTPQSRRRRRSAARRSAAALCGEEEGGVGWGGGWAWQRELDEPLSAGQVCTFGVFAFAALPPLGHTSAAHMHPHTHAHTHTQSHPRMQRSPAAPPPARTARRRPSSARRGGPSRQRRCGGSQSPGAGRHPGSVRAGRGRRRRERVCVLWVGWLGRRRAARKLESGVHCSGCR